MNNILSYNDTLQNINLFKEIDESCYDALVDFSEKISIKKHRYAYKLNDAPNKIYFVLKGRIKICSYNDIGKELIKTIHYPGEMFGEDGLLERNAYEDYALAMDSNVEVLAIATNDLKRYLCNNPSLSIKLSTRIGCKLKAAQKRIENFVFKSARTRIVDFIKELAQKQGQAIGHEILIKNFLTHNEIAGLIGTSRQTVTIVLNELKKKNQIHIDRRNVLVRDIQNLS